ncbi:cytochrome c-type biogenesis protein CcmH [Gemmatimonadota bacterium]
MLAKLSWLVFLVVAAAPLSSLFAQTGEAQNDAELNREARIIFETVLSPYCPGRTISNCPSPQAEELRTEIKEKLAAGQAADEVKEELYATFGDDLRTVPRARGFGLLAWIVPGIGFLAGGWAIAAWMGRTRTPDTQASEPMAVDLDPETQARLDAEMSELESMT